MTERLGNKDFQEDDINLELVAKIKNIGSFPVNVKDAVVNAIIATLSNKPELFDDNPKSLEYEILLQIEYWTRPINKTKALMCQGILDSEEFKMRIVSLKCAYDFDSLLKSQKDIFEVLLKRQLFIILKSDEKASKNDIKLNLINILKQSLENLKSGLDAGEASKSDKLYGADINAWAKADRFRNLLININDIGKFILGSKTNGK